MCRDEGTPKIWSVDFKLDSEECQLPHVPMHVLSCGIIPGALASTHVSSNDTSQ
jgi:hypothetical protein